MNELKPIEVSELVNETGDVMTVDGRKLHMFLEVGTEYSHWITRMFGYGFTEGQDFNSVKFDGVRIEGNRNVKRNLINHLLTIDMAKEICMLQRNDKGKEARQYFLQIEREWNSPATVMARALKMANKQLTDAQTQVAALTNRVEEMRPKEIFADAVSASNTSILVGEMAKILKQNGVDTGEKRFFKFLREKGYLISRNGTDYNMPTQRSMELKIFEVKERCINNPDGSVKITKTPKINGKGQQYFINLLVDKKDKAAEEALAR